MQAPGAARGRGSMWDPDEPLAALSTRVHRAAGVAAVWAVAAMPVALGWQGCAVATLLHRPCPGCGMTRALRLLAAGDVGASLRMHPLAVPVLAVGLLFMAATVWSTLALGSPIHVHESRLGRWSIAALAAVYAAALALWIARWFGAFGGPVAVY